MMPSDRLAQLQKFYEDDPSDPFNLYALALEYLKCDAAKARSFFEVLLEQHPAYVPTYYHAAKYFQDAGERERAAEVYQKGISVAEAALDAKAARELRSAYDELMFE